MFFYAGGQPAGSEILASRAESGDPQVLTDSINDALFIATGSDPYKLLKYAYSVVSERMGTFRTRDKKVHSIIFPSFVFYFCDHIN